MALHSSENFRINAHALRYLYLSLLYPGNPKTYGFFSGTPASFRNFKIKITLLNKSFDSKTGTVRPNLPLMQNLIYF